jgi:hypothetical protein
MWAIFLFHNQIISHKLFEWLKLISMTMVLGNVEGERCFFTHHTFRLGIAYVCNKTLFFGNFPFFNSNEIMDTKEGSNGSKAITTFYIKACYLSLKHFLAS